MNHCLEEYAEQLNCRITKFVLMGLQIILTEDYIILSYIIKYVVSVCIES